jgi:hypothetical protein
MGVKPTPSLFLRLSKQVKIPSYDDRMQIVLSQVYQLTKKSGFMHILHGFIDRNQTPYEVIIPIPNVEFNMKITTGII